MIGWCVHYELQVLCSNLTCCISVLFFYLLMEFIIEYVTSEREDVATHKQPCEFCLRKCKSRVALSRTWIVGQIKNFVRFNPTHIIVYSDWYRFNDVSYNTAYHICVVQDALFLTHSVEFSRKARTTKLFRDHICRHFNSSFE